MLRFGVFVLLAATAAGGCASPAKYVERKADSGIVAVPDGTGDRSAAIALIEKHVGPNYEILDERTVPTGQSARANPRPDGDHTLNARNPAYPAKRPTTADATAREDGAVLQITYQRRTTIPAPRDLRSQEEPGLTPNVRPISAFNRPAPASGGADCNH